MVTSVGAQKTGRSKCSVVRNQAMNSDQFGLLFSSNYSLATMQNGFPLEVNDLLLLLFVV